MKEIYPWMKQDFERLCSLADAGRLPHGLLFAGPAEIGKHDLAMALAMRLLCQSQGAADLLGEDDSQGKAAACGVCPSCHLFNAGTHPDLMLVTLEESRQIRVAQIRDLAEWSLQTAGQSERKVAIIDPADTMNEQASNALLKCLEEPAPDTFMVLITNQQKQLLPTIRSRCQQRVFPLPDQDQAAKWLQAEPSAGEDVSKLLIVADGCPLKARGLDKEYLELRGKLAKTLADVIGGKSAALELVNQLATEDPGKVIELLWQLTADSVKYGFSSDEKTIKNKDISSQVKAFSKQVSIDDQLRLCDRLLSARRILAEPANANPAMLLEWVLMAGQDREIAILPPATAS